MSKGHIVLVTGDQFAVAHCMGMERHNGKSPCRYCHIQGLCIRRTGSSANQDRGSYHYYFPHTNRSDFDIEHLDMRHDLAGDMLRFLDEGRAEKFTRRIQDQQDRDSGIRLHHYSAIHSLQSLHFPRSSPPDIMHLSLLNIAKDITYMWMGGFHQILQPLHIHSTCSRKMTGLILGQRWLAQRQLCLLTWVAGHETSPSIMQVSRPQSGAIG